MKVLVTGATGFLGSELLRILISKNIATVALIRGRALPPDFPQVISYTLPQLLKSDFAPDYIFHLAASIPKKGQDRPLPESLLSQTQLSQTLIERFPKAHFIFASSISVYGNAAPLISEELTTVNPSYYGLAKLAGEATVSLLASQYSIVRFPSLVGKKMKPNSFLPIVCARAKAKAPVQLWGDGKRTQSYLHVQDAANFLYEVTQQSNATGVLLPSWNSHSDLEVLETLMTITPTSSIERVSGPNGLVRVFNNTSTENKVLFRPQWNIVKILTELVSE